jgi:hypothetical protein
MFLSAPQDKFFEKSIPCKHCVEPSRILGRSGSLVPDPDLSICQNNPTSFTES